jgi:hypothetical protein
MDGLIRLHLAAAWLGILLGVVSGALLGLFFHREDWWGGYASHRRRLARLGHISFFGLGLLNLAFALTLPYTGPAGLAARIAGAGFLVGAVTMPTCCFLTAWRPGWRVLFPIPVLSIATGVTVLFALLLRSPYAANTLPL